MQAAVYFTTTAIYTNISCAFMFPPSIRNHDQPSPARSPKKKKVNAKNTSSTPNARCACYPHRRNVAKGKDEQLMRKSTQSNGTNRIIPEGKNNTSAKTTPNTIIPSQSNSCGSKQLVEPKLGKQGIHGHPLSTAFLQVLVHNTLDSAESDTIVFGKCQDCITVLP